MPEQAAFDVRFYDLQVRIEPADSSILGSLAATVTVLESLDAVVLHLDGRLRVRQAGLTIGDRFREGPFRQEGGLVRVSLGRSVPAGEEVTVRVDYAGTPLISEAPQSSWADGFRWARTEGGDPWIGVVSVLEGADVWWPVKDHPSDEPDSMAIHIRVPDPLRVAANGRLRRVEKHADDTSTHHWFISTPINNYGVSVTVAPFEVLETTYESTEGGRFPFQFWVLPERIEEARVLFPQMQAHMRFFEDLLGPYPFRADKYAVAHSPYVAMEHQSIIAYGADFTDNEFGFDFYHFHELAHEWWANKLTAVDWGDWWLHEGFATYLEALYAEELGGQAAYHRYVATWPERVANRSPIVPGPNATTHDAYTGDIYRKGATVLHMVRYLIGREGIISVLRELQDPGGIEGGGDCGCRFIDTEELRRTILSVSGQDLGRFFEVYLEEAAIPRLSVMRLEGRLELAWITADDLPLELPVEVRVGQVMRRLEMRGGRGSTLVERGAEVEIDPNDWLLMTVETDGSAATRLLRSSR